MSKIKTQKQILRDQEWRAGRLIYGVDAEGNIAIALRGDQIWRWVEQPGFYRETEDLGMIPDFMSEARFERYVEIERRIIAGEL